MMINQVVFLFGTCYVIAIVLFITYISQVKGAGKKKWELLVYLLVASILVGIISKLGFVEFTRLPIWVFISAQVWLLLIGILHIWLFEKFFKLEQGNLGKILFTMAILFFGYGLVIMSFKVYYHSPFPRLYFLPAFFFITPTFVMIAYNYFIKIPANVYKVWDFPAPGTLADPKDNELADLIIVNFEICKQCEDKRTVFKAKAPQGMVLGKLFYFFIGDYNSRNPNNPILINDNEIKRYKWSFYRPAGLFRGRIHLDPELTISANRIKENASIICERINPN